jgi:RND family efflux transporter MFP subunit
MKRTSWILLAVLLIGLIGYKAGVKILERRSISTQGVQGGPRWGNSVPIVTAVTVTPQRIEETLDLTGTIAPETEVPVQPRINGRLLTLQAEEGQFVKAGEVLGEIDTESIELQIQQSLASLSQIKAGVQQAEINVAKLKLERDRYRNLLEKKYVSQSEFDSVEASYQTSLAVLQGVLSQQSAAEKNHDLLRLQLKQTRVTAPITGFVLKKDVTAGTNVTTGTSILTLVPLDRVKLLFEVDQTQATKVHAGMTVTFYTDESASTMTKFQGKIQDIAPAYDPQTRALQLTSILQNQGRRLLPGMFGNVVIVLGVKEDALAVPQEAVIQRDGVMGVFVADESGTTEFRPVQTGLVAKGRIEVLSGLQADELVVVAGQNRLRDGQTVEVLTLDGASEAANASGKRNNKKIGERSKKGREQERGGDRS